MHIYEKLGVRRLINARSFSTKAGGSALPREVLEAMSQAAECCVRMDELQSAASDVISQATGAEAGIVTSGAAAALTLGNPASAPHFEHLSSVSLIGFLQFEQVTMRANALIP